MVPVPSSRINKFGVITVLAIAGLGIRSVPEFWGANFLGVALWASIVYCLISIFDSKDSFARRVLLSALISIVVETSQLTPWPLMAAKAFPPLYIIWGAYFDILDLPAYAVGIGISAIIHWLYTKKNGL